MEKYILTHSIRLEEIGHQKANKVKETVLSNFYGELMTSGHYQELDGDPLLTAKGHSNLVVFQIEGYTLGDISNIKNCFINAVENLKL